MRTASEAGYRPTSSIFRHPATLLAAIALIACTAVLLWFAQALWLRWLAIMALGWFLPGALLVAHWRLPQLDLPSASVLAAGLGLCWMVLWALVLHWLPGPLELWMLVAAYAAGALLLLVALYWRRPICLRTTNRRTWGWLLALLLLACLLRLPGLGYHELHGDETMVLHRAKWAILGEDDVLARHAKGPGEIAVSMVVYRALGTANESTTRLPFALMGICSVLAVAVLGRSLFSSAVGIWAGVLLALNGFALALSRMVQYQAAVLLLSILAVYSAWRFAREGRGRWLALAAIFGGFGVLMHYEFALVAPVLLILAWWGWRAARNRRQVVLVTLLAGAFAVAVVATTYLPGVFNPRFARTQRYLGSRLGGLGAFNLPTFIELGTFYNGTYLFVGLILLVVAGLIVGWRFARKRTLLLTLWFLPFFLLHLLVMQYPGTHFYIFMPSWSVLAALPLAALTGADFEHRFDGQSWSFAPALRWGVRIVVAIWLAISAGYLYLTFFRQAPEYVVNYDQARLPFYWAPYGENVPQRPRYAVPIQEGWKALGSLAGWGCLAGTFASNEGSQSLRFWYLLPMERVSFGANPDYVFVAAHQQAPYPRYDTSRLEGYQKVGDVRLRGEPRIEMWARAPLPVAYVMYDVEQFSRAFDRSVPLLGDWPDSMTEVQNGALGEGATLEATALSAGTLSRGDTLAINLIWRLDQPLAQDYKAFVHVADAKGRPLAQWDGFPCLNLGRTSQWTVGEPVRDHVLMTIPEEMPSGEYPVLVGLYDDATGERLGDRSIEVGTISVR